MRTTLSVLALAAMMISPNVFAAGDAKAGEQAAAVCAACHGADGNKTLDNSYPKLGGQYVDYLVKALEDYRSGARNNAIMNGQAMALKDEDIANIAAWYSEQKSEMQDLRHFK